MIAFAIFDIVLASYFLIGTHFTAMVKQQGQQQLILKEMHNDEIDLLKNSYRNSLQLAEHYHCQTVAFPSISTGVYGFPVEQAAVIAIKTIREFLTASRWVQEVIMVAFDPKTEAAYQKAL